LTNNLPSKTPSKSDIYEAFNKTYADLNASIDHLSSASGTTASIAIKVDNDLYVSNLGDSRTLLLKADGSFIQCTEDAKVSTGGLRPTLTRFGEKIKKIAEKGISFASRFFHPPVNRVLDPQRNRLKNVQGGMGIGMASVLGDIDCCPQALRKPKISGPYPLNSGDRLLSASDGVFDLLSSSQVNTLAKSLPSSQIPAHIAQISMNVAFLAYGQKADQVDNTSVLCTDLIPL
jgi:serine/threonine protein phosphatase PrpC